MNMDEATNIADYLFNSSQYAVHQLPGTLAEVLSSLLWTMDDNGKEIMGAIEGWLESDDYFHVREGLAIDSMLPFSDQNKMEAVLGHIKTRWPDLSDRCDELIASRKSFPRR